MYMAPNDLVHIRQNDFTGPEALISTLTIELVLVKYNHEEYS